MFVKVVLAPGDLLGQAEVHLADAVQVDDLVALLPTLFPELRRLSLAEFEPLVVRVNGKRVRRMFRLHDEDQVSIILESSLAREAEL